MTHGIRDRKRLFRKNRKGGIEGLPLELMIIVIVATLGTAILVGWMGDIDEPKSIGEVSSNTSYIDTAGAAPTKTYALDITVTDNHGDGIPGAVVILTGAGIHKGSSASVVMETNSLGVASFKDFTLNLNGAKLGYINVHVSASGYGENDSVKVTVVG